jgi:hypothetical protein
VSSCWKKYFLYAKSERNLSRDLLVWFLPGFLRFLRKLGKKNGLRISFERYPLWAKAEILTTTNSVFFRKTFQKILEYYLKFRHDRILPISSPVQYLLSFRSLTSFIVWYSNSVFKHSANTNIRKQQFLLLISKGRRTLIECGTNMSRDTTLRHALVVFPRR